MAGTMVPNHTEKGPNSQRQGELANLNSLGLGLTGSVFPQLFFSSGIVVPPLEMLEDVRVKQTASGTQWFAFEQGPGGLW